MRILVLVTMLVGMGTARAEVSCFRTPVQAAVQVGVREGGGYRLEMVRRDAFGGKNWATVRSCVHPEWPAVVVRTGLATHLNDDKAVVEVGHPQAALAVVNGAAVRVVQVVGMARMEMSGVVQSGGRVGDQVWVRIAAPIEGSEGRLALAVVRSAEVLEIGQ